MVDLIVFKQVVDTYWQLSEQVETGLQRPAQIKQSAALKAAFEAEDEVEVVARLDLFLSQCQELLKGTLAPTVSEILGVVLTEWPKQLCMSGRVEAWQDEIAPDSASELVTAYETSKIYNPQFEPSQRLSDLIKRLLNEGSEADDLSDVENEALIVLRRLSMAMDRGDVAAIQDAALKLAGHVAVVAEPSSRLKRYAAAGLSALRVSALGLGIAASVATLHLYIDDQFLSEERQAIEFEISKPLELTEGQQPGELAEADAGGASQSSEEE